MAKGEIKLPELSRLVDDLRELLDKPEVKALSELGRALQAGQSFDAQMKRVGEQILEGARRSPVLGYHGVAARREARQDEPMRPMTLAYAKRMLTRRDERIARLRKALDDLHTAHRSEVKRAGTLDRSNFKLRERVGELERRARERDTGEPPAFAPYDRIRVNVSPHIIELRIDQIEWHISNGWLIKCSDMRSPGPMQFPLPFADRHPLA